MRQWQSAFCRSIFRNWVEHFLSIYIFISNLYCGNVFMAIPHKNKKVNRQFYFLAKVTRYKMGVPNTCSIWMFGTWRFLVARSHAHRARFTLLLFVLLDGSRKKKVAPLYEKQKTPKKKMPTKKFMYLQCAKNIVTSRCWVQCKKCYFDRIVRRYWILKCSLNQMRQCTKAARWQPNNISIRMIFRIELQSLILILFK